MKQRLIIFLLLISIGAFAKDYSVKSPNGKIVVTVSDTDQLNWSATVNGQAIFSKNVISLDLGALKAGVAPRVLSAKTTSTSTVETAVVPVKSKQVKNEYTELNLKCKGDYAVSFRVFNEGIAYRFETNLKNDVEVINEQVDLNFAGNYATLFPEEATLISHYERNYLDEKIGDIAKGKFCSLPTLVKADNNIKIGITESDLYDYPCLFLEAAGGTSFKSKFPKAVLDVQQNGDRSENITKEAAYIAKTKGTRSFPWRIFMISENDAQLLENQMVFLLSRPTQMTNTAWIKPGKVAWDWWNDNNIYGVDFKSGINTQTYKYYVDLASKYGLEYIILDEGWSVTTTNLLKPNTELDLTELISYAKSKNVGVILWLLWGPLDRDMTTILDQFKAWGVKGVKVDFMQRADQYMVNFYERAARECAKREMLIDYHGAFKPSGQLRAYPNIVNHEGVKGMENCKWSEEITPIHDVTLPFTRMLAGPMDFTPGAMLNAQKSDFKVSFSNPMSQGTRCHQVAMYVAYDAPLQMLCDNPSNYYREAETTSFISKIPTTWDETIGLKAEVGKYLAMARKNADKWYIGAMNNWDERELEIDLSFLGSGSYNLEIMQDGINANKVTKDYKKTNTTVKAGDKLKIKMAKGGGWAAICTKK